MSVKRKFRICGILLVVIPLIMIGCLWLVLNALFALFRPTAQISFAEGLKCSHPIILWVIALWSGVSFLAMLGIEVACLVYLYRSAVSPLKNFEIAMRHLKQGNLEHEFVGSGDAEIQQLCQAYEELRHKLRRTVEEELEREREQKLMLANISHDIKTPVTAIRGYVEGILDGVARDAEQQKKYLKTIYAKSNIIERLAENLSLYAKLETKRIQYHFAIEDIRDSVKEAIEEAEIDAETRHIRLTATLPETPCLVKMDGTAMKRVFANLIGNAVKYQKKGGGNICISGECSEQGILLRVSDDGIGIAEQDLGRIFEAFYRGDPSRNGAVGGNGLGLSICRKIIEDHGGKIWIRSEDGTGTEVMVLLPMRKG